MNNIRATQRLNQLELQSGSTGASWHDEYKDSAYVYAGGLDNDLTEGDVITIMSQFGEIVDINMPRNKQTGKTQGFAFLMYEDQRSTVLAVDNLNGAQVLGRTLRVDHVKNYKQMERGEDGKMKERETQSLNALPEKFITTQDADSVMDSPDPDIDPDDPMAAYLLEQKGENKRKRSLKHEGETKEERHARKERKRAKRQAKEAQSGRPDFDVRPREWVRDSDVGYRSYRHGSPDRDADDKWREGEDRADRRGHSDHRDSDDERERRYERTRDTRDRYESRDRRDDIGEGRKGRDLDGDRSRYNRGYDR